MKQTAYTLPIFEPNQVLTNRHLNLLVDYLDEQARLTRAALIGTGIACGLELAMDVNAGTVTLGRGCAVGTDGYLLVIEEPRTMAYYREYKLPDGDQYEPLRSGGEPLTLFELLVEDVADASAIAATPRFLANREILLFLELDARDLSDCSPNNCDDKGIERRCEVRVLALDRSQTQRFVDSERVERERVRLTLPDVAMPRYDVPAAGPQSSHEVLEGFQVAIQRAAVVSGLARALEAAYVAYRPLLEGDFPASPFGRFYPRFGFLESLPGSAAQVLFLQYYFDAMRDLIAAYEEFRWRALDLDCQCCAALNSYPRHVLLGPQHRHRWTPAAATQAACEPLREELRLLFKRLVEMTLRFSDQPSLPGLNRKQRIDSQIRITPSRYGDVDLSHKAIPYYYEFTARPPLYELWNPRLTRRGRANRNLGYRADSYLPPPPPEVTTALLYELEPYGFFRVEGHLGKDYRRVLLALESQRSRLRLPFDIVAVHTGSLDGGLPIDPRDHECSFQDLETLYAALRAELICLAEKTLREFGRLKLKDGAVAGFTAARAAAASPSAAARDTLRARFEALTPTHFATAGTVGQLFAKRVAAAGFDELEVATARPKLNFLLRSMSLLLRFTAALETSLSAIDWEAFQVLWNRLKTLSEEIANGTDDEDADGLTWQEFNRQVAAVVYACRIEALVALRDEYLRRLEKITDLQRFASYAARNPSLQHAGGVPRGGTFVLVVHGPEPDDATDVRTSVAARLRRVRAGRPSALKDPYEAALGDVGAGTVIADFFVPYLCVSNCPVIQYNILSAPQEPPAVDPPVLAAEVGCTSSKNTAPVRLQITGGTAPFKVSVDGASPQAFAEQLQLPPGTHSLQVEAADGVRSEAIAVTVAEQLRLSEVSFTDNVADGSYTATFTASGGQPPYVASQGRVLEERVDVGPLASGESATVMVFDARKCQASTTFEHVIDSGCDKPCDGKALRIHYPVWFQLDGRQTLRFRSFEEGALEVFDKNGDTLVKVDLAQVLTGLMVGGEITPENYDPLMAQVAAAVTRLGRGLFTLAYDAREPGVFSLEYYICHRFLLRVRFAAVVDGTDIAELWTYGNTSLSVTRAKPRHVYRMPPLGSVPIDRCRNTEGADCRTTILSIKPKQTEAGVVLSATFDRDVDPATLQYYWRIETPELMTANTAEVEIPTQGVTALRFQLAVLSEAGCWDFASGQFGATRRTRLRIAPRNG